MSLDAGQAREQADAAAEAARVEEAAAKLREEEAEKLELAAAAARERLQTVRDPLSAPLLHAASRTTGPHELELRGPAALGCGRL